MAVARVLDSHTVVVTGGAAAGITVGDELRICEDIIDPQTGDKIGTYPDLPVRVTEVHSKFCVAETFRRVKGRSATVTINIGDSVQRENCG